MSIDAASSVGARVKAFLRLVVIEHSVFALPFAYLSMFTAMWLTAAEPERFDWAPGRDGGFVAYLPAMGWFKWDVFVLVTIAMVAARTFAMAANRIIDRHVDARNPRTANRELVTGAVSLRTAYIGSGVALAVFFLAALLLNPLCLALSPLAVVPLVVYPYGKRFTDFPHAILGLAQLVAPVGAWLAVTGTFVGMLPGIVLGLAVGLWIGGFDLIYACQDIEVDRSVGVRSFPARFGIAASLHTSTVTHILTLGLFVWFGLLTAFGFWYWAGVLVTGAVFAYEHAIVKPHDLSRLNRAFFTANGVVGIALFGISLLDLLTRA